MVNINILNDYFGTVFTVEDTGEVPSMGDNCLTTVVILKESVDYFESRQVWRFRWLPSLCPP